MTAEPLTREQRLDALRALSRPRCRCGRAKHSKQCFCRQCYYGLPKELRNKLYKPFGGGYEEAYWEAAEIIDQD